MCFARSSQHDAAAVGSGTAQRGQLQTSAPKHSSRIGGFGAQAAEYHTALPCGRADGSTKHLHSFSVTQLAGLDAVAAQQAFVQDSCCVCE
jgi:hypothetical protein